MGVNDDFGLSDDAALAAAVNTGKKKAPVPPREVDPELDKANWPVIFIDSEDGKPNYEYVAAHGTLRNGKRFNHECQIMRGVDVPVPPSIMHVLQRTVATHYVQVKDPATGRNNLRPQERSAIPWRLVKGGKYF